MDFYHVLESRRTIRDFSDRAVSDEVLEKILAHAIFEVEVPENWISKTIGQLDIRKKFGINIVAIREDDKINMAISPNTIFQSGTTLLVLGEYKELQKCFRM